MHEVDEFTLWLWLCSFNYELIPLSLQWLKNGCDSVKAQFQKWHSKSFNRRKEKYLNHNYILDVQEMSWAVQVVTPQIELKAQVRQVPSFKGTGWPWDTHKMRSLTQVTCSETSGWSELFHQASSTFPDPTWMWVFREHMKLQAGATPFSSKSAKCLCSGKSNQVKLSSGMEENPSDLHGYLLASLLLNSKVSCWGQAQITALSGLILQMRREPQDEQKRIKIFWILCPFSTLTKNFPTSCHTAIESSGKSQKPTKLKLSGMYSPRGIYVIAETQLHHHPHAHSNRLEGTATPSLLDHFPND